MTTEVFVPVMGSRWHGKDKGGFLCSMIWISAFPQAQTVVMSPVISDIKLK